MGCTNSRAVQEAAKNVNPYKGTENMLAAMNLHKASTKWRSYKAPIDINLLRELGLLSDDEDDEKSDENKKQSPSSDTTATSEHEEEPPSSADLSEYNTPAKQQQQSSGR